MNNTVNYNAQISKSIKENETNRKIHVYSWGRDCDMCESDCVDVIPASVVHYKAFVDRLYSNAEGPVRVCIISPKDAKEFKSEFRDLITEAYEMVGGSPFFL